MTLPCFVWMLSECGHISALPRGTPTVDALATGPVYELVLRSQPSVKLLYNHKPNSNVNETASNLAGHTVNGDACLVFSLTPSTFASPALLLNSLLRPARAASRSRRQHGLRQTPRPSHLRLNTSAGTSPNQQLPDSGNPRRSSLDWRASCGSAPPRAGCQSLGSPLLDQQGEVSSAGQRDVTLLSDGCSSSSSCPVDGRLSRHRWMNGTACPQERQQAVCAVLGSRNASTAATGTAGDDGGAAPAGASSADPTGVPSRCARRLNDEMMQVQQPPCKSARSSGEFHPHRRGSLTGADPWVNAAAAESAMSSAFNSALLPGSVVCTAADQLAGMAVVTARERLERLSSVSEQPGECSACMELDDTGNGSLATGEIGGMARGDAVAVVCEPGGLRCSSWPGLWQDREGLGGPVVDGACCRGDADAAAVDAAGRSTSDSMMDTEGGDGHEEVKAEETSRDDIAVATGVAWAELAGDALVCIAMQMPQQASQSMNMAAVCRGWRSALLGHSPLLRRLAFALDLTRPLRTSQPPPATLSSPVLPAPSPSSTSAVPPTPVDAAAQSLEQTRSPSILFRAAAPSSPRAEGTLLDNGLDEGQVLAAAIAQQHATGAFLLSSHGPRAPHDGRVQEPAACDPVADGGPSATVPPAMAAAPGPAPSPAVVLELRGAVRSWLPKPLLAAAHAGNPSAQLVMAQLLEATDDARGSLRWWRKLAQTGDLMAMFKLGMATYDGSHGLQPDPEAAHLWLGRTVRKVLQVDTLSAICLDGHQAGGRAAAAAGAAVAAAAATSEWDVRRTGGHEQHRQRGSRPHCGRVGPALQATVAALDPPRLHMLAWSSIVLGYLEFDGVAGRAVWGMGERSEAVRLFRLAEACGLAEASAVLGWLYNTGQY